MRRQSYCGHDAPEGLQWIWDTAQKHPVLYRSSCLIKYEAWSLCLPCAAVQAGAAHSGHDAPESLQGLWGHCTQALYALQLIFDQVSSLAYPLCVMQAGAAHRGHDTPEGRVCEVLQPCLLDQPHQPGLRHLSGRPGSHRERSHAHWAASHVSNPSTRPLQQTKTKRPCPSRGKILG